MLRLRRYGVVPSISKDVDRRVLRGAKKHCGLGDLVKELISDSDNNNVKESSNEIPAEKSSMADWLKLNVGGTIFETRRSTLTSECEYILARMFEPNSNLPPATVTDEGCYHIDACPRGLVLNWLSYRSLILSSEVKAEDVLPVADYFGLSELRTLLEKQQETEEEVQGKLITPIKEGVEKMEELTGINDKLEDFKVEVGEFYCNHFT